MNKRHYIKRAPALTAGVLTEEKAECLKAGCNEHLSKPIDRARLLATLSRYLPSGDDAIGDGHKAVEAQVDDLTELASEPSGSGYPPGISPESQNEEDVIDWQDLVSRVKNEALIEKIASVFLVEYPAQIELLAQAVRTAWAEDVHSQAHALKGAAASMGAKLLSQAAYQLECAGRERNEQIFAALFLRIQTEFDRVAAFISRDDWMDIAKQKSMTKGHMKQEDERWALSARNQ